MKNPREAKLATPTRPKETSITMPQQNSKAPEPMWQWTHSENGRTRKPCQCTRRNHSSPFGRSTAGGTRKARQLNKKLTLSPPTNDQPQPLRGYIKRVMTRSPFVNKVAARKGPKQRMEDSAQKGVGWKSHSLNRNEKDAAPSQDHANTLLEVFSEITGCA